MRTVVCFLLWSSVAIATEPPQAPPLSNEPPQAPPVVKKIVASQTGYKAAVEAVLKGQRIKLYAGVTAPSGHDYSCAKLDGFAAGVYDCYMFNGQPCFELVGAQPLLKQSGQPGQHSHRCGNCGYTFWHGHDATGQATGEGFPDHLCPRCKSGPWNVVDGWR